MMGKCLVFLCLTLFYLSVLTADAATTYRQTLLVADDGLPYDRFGYNLDMDGYNIAVGAILGDGITIDSGKAYVYHEVTPDAGDWTQVASLEAPDGAQDDWFGVGISISGQNIAVGAHYDDDIGTNSGAVYIFHETILDAGDWTYVTKLASPDLSSLDNFGRRCSLSGTNLVIGSHTDDDTSYNSGSAYVFAESIVGNYDFVFVTKLTADDGDYQDMFGLRLNMDGNNIAIAAPNDNSVSGAVYVFHEVTPGAGDWTQVAKLVANDASPGDKFGDDVAISGQNIVIGAGQDTPEYGSSSSLPEYGSAYVFHEVTLDAGDWVQVAMLTSPTQNNYDWFGGAVAIDGQNIAVGAPYDDDETLAYSSSGWGSELSSEYYESGAVYVWHEMTLGAGDWTRVLKIKAGDGTYDMQFGRSVAISGLNVAGGQAPWPAAASLTQGSVYVGNLDFVDDCPSNLCEHGSTCVDGYYAYTCTCPFPYSGALCEICDCLAPAVCADNLGVGYCDCTNTNTYDTYCNATCLNGGSDNAATNWMSCDCSGTNSVGLGCENTCNKGIADVTFTSCDCYGSGANGTFCEVDLDDCLSSPCANGGVCSDNGSESHAYNCSCIDPYEGLTCTGTICDSSPCGPGTCDIGDGSGGFTCNCTNTGFEGNLCQSKFDFCSSSPCVKGVCVSEALGYSCNCTGTGKTGTDCTEDVDDCASSPCVNNGTCTDTGKNKFVCDCSSGYEDAMCQTNTDDCLSSPCQNGGLCADITTTVHEFACDCSTAVPSSSGLLCEEAIDLCLSSPCANGEACNWKQGKGVYECSSTNDVCLSNPCLNDKVCSVVADSNSGYTCEANATINDSNITIVEPPTCVSPCIEGELTFELTNTSLLADFLTTLTEDLSSALDDDVQVIAITVPRAYEDLFSGDPPMFVTSSGLLIPVYYGEYSVTIIIQNADGKTANDIAIIIASDPVIISKATILDFEGHVDIVVDEPEPENDGEKEDDDTGTLVTISFILCILVVVAAAVLFFIFKRNKKEKIMTVPV